MNTDNILTPEGTIDYIHLSGNVYSIATICKTLNRQPIFNGLTDKPFSRAAFAVFSVELYNRLINNHQIVKFLQAQGYLEANDLSIITHDIQNAHLFRAAIILFDCDLSYSTGKNFNLKVDILSRLGLTVSLIDSEVVRIIIELALNILENSLYSEYRDNDLYTAFKALITRTIEYKEVYPTAFNVYVHKILREANVNHLKIYNPF